MQLNLSLCTKERFLLLRFGMMIDDLIYKQASAVRHFSPADCSKITVFNSRHEIGKIPVKIQRYSSPLFTAAVRKNFISSAVAMFRSSDVSVVIIIPLSKEKKFSNQIPEPIINSRLQNIIYNLRCFNETTIKPSGLGNNSPNKYKLWVHQCDETAQTWKNLFLAALFPSSFPGNQFSNTFPLIPF